MACNYQNVCKHHFTVNRGGKNIVFSDNFNIKNNSQTSAVHDHILSCKTVICPEDFSILAKSSYNFKLKIQESILIKLKL